MKHVLHPLTFLEQLNRIMECSHIVHLPSSAHFTCTCSLNKACFWLAIYDLLVVALFQARHKWKSHETKWNATKRNKIGAKLNGKNGNKEHNFRQQNEGFWKLFDVYTSICIVYIYIHVYIAYTYTCTYSTRQKKVNKGRVR